jgi:DNA replication factor GINS
MEKIGNNPFSFESYLLRDTQRIVAEICERREHKISNSAVMNVQRSYQLFKELGEDPNIPPPRNSTSEEQILYMELFNSLLKHRKGINYPISSSIVKKRQKVIKTTPEPQVQEKMDKIENRLKGDEISANPESRLKVDIIKEFGEEPIQSSEHNKNESIALNSVKTPLKKDKNLHKSNIGLTGQNIGTEIIMITDKLPSIMGVDSNVYGPLLPGDIITMPEPNARILIKKQKGKLIQRYK